MRRDLISTVIGLVVIGGIIFATFWYGNHQRKTELTVSPTPKVTASSTVKAVAVVTPSATAMITTPKTSAAALKTPKPTQTPKPTPTPKVSVAVTPKPTATSTPVTVPSTTMPQTGAMTSSILALAFMSIVGTFWIGGRRRLSLAYRTLR